MIILHFKKTVLTLKKTMGIVLYGNKFTCTGFVMVVMLNVVVVKYKFDHSSTPINYSCVSFFLLCKQYSVLSFLFVRIVVSG